MRFMAGETYIEAVQRKKYLYRGWAIRGARKAGKWFWVRQDSTGHWRVYAMSPDEIARAKRDISFNQIIQEVYREPIQKELNKASALFRLVAKK